MAFGPAFRTDGTESSDGGPNWELFAPNYVGHVAGFEDLHGAEAVTQFAATERQAFPDLQSTVEDLIAEGDKVVTFSRAHATHRGESEAFGPPTGKQIEVTGMVIQRFAEGKIVEDRTVLDALGMMQQLGLVPQAGQA